MKTEETIKELKESTDKPLKEFLSEYGADAQVDMAIEEMSELTKAFLKWRRSRKNVMLLKKTSENIAEEIADVRIMLRRMELLFGCESQVREQMEYKVQRQMERLEERRKEINKNGKHKD